MKFTNLHLLLYFCFGALQDQLFAADFPLIPKLEVTPGKLCDRPVKMRYPEGIDYCERDVCFVQYDAIILLYVKNLVIE